MSKLKKLMLTTMLLVSTFTGNEVQAQACSSYTTWTPGMFIGPAGYNCAGGVPFYQIVSYNGRLYTHKGYCSSSGPGTWDFLDIGACATCTNRTVGAASSSPTLCANTAIITSITHATTQVTGIASSTGLPAGVSPLYSGNVITISGTPSVAGTFNYTITPTSSCGTATATGTITVSPASVAGTVTGNQTIGANAQPANITLSGNVGSVVKWQKSSDAGFTNPIDIASTSTTLTGAVAGAISTTTYFRAVVQSGSCSTANSSYVTVTVDATAPNAPVVTSANGTTVTGTAEANSIVKVYNGATLIGTATAAANGTYTVSVSPTQTTGTSLTVNATDAANNVSANTLVTVDITLNLKVFVEGLYLANGLMKAVLFNRGIETDPTACDYITVELRESLHLSNPAVSSITTILHTDGTAQITVPSTINGGNYFIVIKHRNTIQTWSKNPVTFTSVTTFDFIQ